jgi:hypothetical protein
MTTIDENLFLAVLTSLGEKIYEHQTGLLAMFNLCLGKKLFTMDDFLAEKSKAESFPEIRKLRRFLDDLHTAKEQADLEAILRKYKGPLQ